MAKSNIVELRPHTTSPAVYGSQQAAAVLRVNAQAQFSPTRKLKKIASRRQRQERENRPCRRLAFKRTQTPNGGLTLSHPGLKEAGHRSAPARRRDQGTQFVGSFGLSCTVGGVAPVAATAVTTFRKARDRSTPSYRKCRAGRCTISDAPHVR
jgi:hypothetical protein